MTTGRIGRLFQGFVRTFSALCTAAIPSITFPKAAAARALASRASSAQEVADLVGCTRSALYKWKRQGSVTKPELLVSKNYTSNKLVLTFFDSDV